MIGRLLFVLAVALATPTAVSAAQCDVVEIRSCTANGECSGPLFEQSERERAQRVAIEYGRAMDVAVEARRDAPGLDRTYDLARMLMPNLVGELRQWPSWCEPVLAGNSHSETQEMAFFESDIDRLVELQRDNNRRALSHAERLAILRSACNTEARRTLSAYLTAALPADQLDEVWSFLISRTGQIPETNPALPLSSPRFTVLTDGQLPLRYYETPAPPHIDNRRERAWQYLQNHRNGRAVMSAVSQFIQSRLSDGRGEAAICPVAHAETQSLIGELAQP